jgi:hypothetical protein
MLESDKHPPAGAAAPQMWLANHFSIPAGGAAARSAELNPAEFALPALGQIR